MDPIISPWIIYFIDVLDNIRYFLKISVSITIFAIITTLISYCDNDEKDNLDKYNSKKSKFKKCFKYYTICICIQILLLIFIPTSELSYKMIAAHYITNDSINVAGETIDHILDKIVEKILKIKNG